MHQVVKTLIFPHSDLNAHYSYHKTFEQLLRSSFFVLDLPETVLDISIQETKISRKSHHLFIKSLSDV